MVFTNHDSSLFLALFYINWGLMLFGKKGLKVNIEVVARNLFDANTPHYIELTVPSPIKFFKLGLAYRR